MISDAYQLISKEYIEDVHAEGMLLRHKKSGARIALLSNNDENKVFNIAFRTPPTNSTGVAHIIEHTVLCGSRKFPLKDPFVELVKGSLNTFLNAMTYPDKTMFPVASCNDADFRNLCDVYLDAVFYPNIYKEEKIFRQEGWHFHLEKPEDPLTYNGVVYNEMKGAFSSADEVLDRTIFNTLFPDTPYGVESGGDPEVIPALTYEEFLDFHKKYYHPSNSYIYFYGNMNMEEQLDWLDREYLSAFTCETIESGIPFQTPFAEPKRVVCEYPILEDEPEEESTYLSTSMVVGSCEDVRLNMAFSILEYVLLDAPGAPVKQALLDAHVGKDIQGSYSDGTLQPFFSVIATDAEAADEERFLTIIHDTLEKLAEEGLDPKALASGINYFEFRFREADFASYPKGLIYGIDLFDSWLYDENRPFDYLKELQVFEDLKKLSKEGYFEELIRTWLLNNPHTAVVTLVPKKGLQAERDAKLAEKLAEVKASLTEQEIAVIVEKTAELKAYQEAPDSEEALDSIPLLKREDIAAKTPVVLSCDPEKADGTTLLKHHYYTNGIGYLTLLFDTAGVPQELIPYLGLLKSVLGFVSTEHYTYGELFHEINANTGGIHCGLQSLPVNKGEEGDKGYRMFAIRAKYLIPRQDFVFDMIREILETSRLEDTKRLYEIIASQKGGLQHSIPAAGHASAAKRALSYQSELSWWSEQTTGIAYFRLMERLEKNFEEEKEDLIKKLQLLMKIIFRPENLTVSLTADDEAFETAGEEVRKLRKALCTEPVENGSLEWKPEQKNEGFKTSGQVQYVALAGNYRKAGFAYTGAFRILKVLLNYEYLWMNIRVQGGAYGCMSAFKRSGDSYLVTYRDPHMKRSWDVFRGLPDFLRNFEADDRTMTKYVIGTISELDTPMNASAKGSLSLNAWYASLTEEDFQKERDEILQAEVADIRALAAPCEAVVSDNNLCVIGSETVLEKDKELLNSLEPLIRE
ncbi:MAG: insulinase family protein [Eubacteriales bacterium]|nr:insulinase family protein [Eubacteriales bacterium]